MDNIETFQSLAERLQGYETDPWAAKAILDAELLTPDVIDPCCGTGILSDAAELAGYRVFGCDIYDWSTRTNCMPPDDVVDWLGECSDPQAPLLDDWSVFMNPPFPQACQFVEAAHDRQARKIVCFQRWSWRESATRAEWWAKYPPARIWLCVERATCWRFDIPHFCPFEEEQCTAKACRKCRGGSTTAHAWFVWERGHKGAEIICNLRRR